MLKFFEYMVQKTEKINWLYSDITCAAIPLKNIDTILEDGTIDKNSALYLVVNGVSQLLFY